MRCNCSTGDVSPGTVVVARPLEDVEALIVACSERVRAMAGRFARSSDGRVEADELYSIGMLEICEAVAAGRGHSVENPVAYLCGAARLAMVEEWRRLYEWSTVSLEKPLSSEYDLTLLDVLAAPVVATAPAVAAVKCERAVRQALERLTPRRRQVLQRRFGLAGYGAHSVQETCGELQATSKAVHIARWRGLADLACDPGLRVVVGLDDALSGQHEEEAWDGAEGWDHTPACPYCGDLSCWCHSDAAYHHVVTMVSQPIDDQQLQALYTCFGLAAAEEVMR